VILLAFAILGFAALSDDFQTLGEEQKEQVEQQTSACKSQKKATPDFGYKPTFAGAFHSWPRMLFTSFSVVLVAVPVVHSCMALELFDTALQTLGAAAGDNIKVAVVLLIFALSGLVVLSDDFQTLAEEEDEHVEQHITACSNLKVTTPELQCNTTSPGLFCGWLRMACVATLAMVLAVVPVVGTSKLLELCHTALQTLGGVGGDNIKLPMVLLSFTISGLVVMSDDFQTLVAEEDEQVEHQVSTCSNMKVATPDLKCHTTCPPSLFCEWPRMLCVAMSAMVLVAVPVVMSSELLELRRAALQTLCGTDGDNVKLSIVLLSFAIFGFVVMSDDFETLAAEEDEQVEQQSLACIKRKVATPYLPGNTPSPGLFCGWLRTLLVATLAMVLVAVPIVWSSELLELCNAALQALGGAAGDNVKLSIVLLGFAILGLVVMIDDFQTIAADEEQQVEQQVVACSNSSVANPDMHDNLTSPGLVHGWHCMLCLSTLAVVPVALPPVDSSVLVDLCNIVVTALQTFGGAASENVAIALLLLTFVAGALAALGDYFKTIADYYVLSASDANDSGHLVISMFASACLVMLAIVVAVRGQNLLQAALDLLSLLSCRGVAIVAAILSLAAANVRSLEPLLKGCSKELGREQCSADGAHKLAQ